MTDILPAIVIGVIVFELVLVVDRLESRLPVFARLTVQVIVVMAGAELARAVSDTPIVVLGGIALSVTAHRMAGK